MPGRTPTEATEAFLAPLREALACVLRAKIVTTKGGRSDPASEHTWTLNGADGARLSTGDVLKARMDYRIVEDEGDRGPWRVTTTGYMYSLEDRAGQELFAAHWHPLTVGVHKRPHLHLPHAAFNDSGVWLAREPIHTGRFTFEELIRLTIKNLQVPTLVEDWQDRLDLAETPHRLYRTWHLDPDEKPKPEPAPEEGSGGVELVP